MGGVGEGGNAALRARPGAPSQPQAAPQVPVPAPAGAPAVGASPVFVVTAPPADDPDASPATAPHKKPKEEPKEESKEAPKDAKDDTKEDLKEDAKKELENGTSANDVSSTPEGSQKGPNKPDDGAPPSS